MKLRLKKYSIFNIQYLYKFRLILLLLTFFGIFLDIFFLKITSSFIVLFLIVFWILSVKLYKFGGRDSVKVALGFLVLCPILLIFNKEAIAEKAAIWVYMFLVVGVIQMMIEVRKEKR